MAFDGAFLHLLSKEIKAIACGNRIDKIYQPTREELVLAMRCQGVNRKLLLSANPSGPRIHFSAQSFENPQQPPMFCMLLRKHLGNAKLVDICQLELERIVYLKFETANEFGDQIVMTLAVEIMGRHSNIILINEHGKVVDSIKRVDEAISSVRRILPGITYELPPPQDKLSLLQAEVSQIAQALQNNKDQVLSKALMAAMQGVSPLLCREISFYTAREFDPPISEMTEDQWNRLEFYLKNLKQQLTGTGRPVMLSEHNKKPKEFSFIPIHQYGHTLISAEYDSYSELLDHFYQAKDQVSRMQQRSHDLLKLLANTSDRISRKLAAQRQELKDCAEREQLRIYGDILNANLYRLQKGDRTAELENFYEEGYPVVHIPLDLRLTPAQNAQKYYSEYRKADTAEKMLTRLIAEGEAELEYIDSVFDSLTRAGSEAELSAIRAELTEGGYLRRAREKQKKNEKLSYLRYRSTDGFLILSGRNNLQNDRLTLKESRNNDLWFHTQKIPGSHTVVVSEGQEIPDSTKEEAAMIAAYNSKARNSSLVPVDFTQIRNIKKPSGAKPGMVIYDVYHTAYITPDEEKVNNLLER